MIRDICTRHDVLLIFDEIITGFGRTGDMFAAQTYGVTPDIICGGKGLATGVIPAGAMMAREDTRGLLLRPARLQRPVPAWPHVRGQPARRGRRHRHDR